MVPERILADGKNRLDRAQEKHEEVVAEVARQDSVSRAVDDVGIPWELVSDIHPYYAYGVGVVRFKTLSSASFAWKQAMEFVNKVSAPAKALAKNDVLRIVPAGFPGSENEASLPVLPATFRANPSASDPEDATYVIEVVARVGNTDIRIDIPVDKETARTRFFCISPVLERRAKGPVKAIVAQTRTYGEQLAWAGPARPRMVTYRRYGQRHMMSEHMLYWATSDVDLSRFPCFAV